MSDLEKLIPDAIPQQYRIIFVGIAVIAVLLVLYLAVSLMVTLVRAVQRHLSRRRFARQYGVKVPAKVEVMKGQVTTTDTYVLRCPTWQHAKADGTRDRRHKANRIVPQRSVIRTQEWEISSYDPIIMNSFVITLRENGHALPLCQQEMNKQGSIMREHTDRFVGSSPVQLYAHFMNDSDGFEEWCAQLLRDNGAQVRVTPSSNDGGYDLDIHENGIRTIAECKCYHPTDGVVGRPLLQKLVGANASEHAQRMTFMTTSRYSAPAVDYAKEQGIELLDGTALIRMDAARRGKAPDSLKTRGMAPSPDDWALTKEEVTAGYPVDYSDRHIMRLKGAVPTAIAIIKLLLLVAVLWMFVQTQRGGLTFPQEWMTALAGKTDADTSDVAVDDDETSGDAPASTWDSIREALTPSGAEYVLPESDTVLCSLDDLMGMSTYDLFVARNEIYARHGYIFNTESLRRHFETCPWYVPRVPSDEFDDGELSQVERENVRRILSVEMPKANGSATYVATYFTREYADSYPERSCAYNGHVDGNLLQIDGTWDITDVDGGDDRNCTEWCFRLSDSARILAGGGDGPNSEPRTLSRTDLEDMLGGPSGLGLRLITDASGEVTEIEWLS